jgi:cell wall-associated NlpC family hydrolase
MTPEQRTAIVAEAESWLRTPYHSNAAVKGSGADCALMPLAIYRAVIPDLPQLPMPRYVEQWHLHRDEEKYLGYVRALGAIEIPEADVQPGDFVLWHIGRVYSHGAIVTSWPNVIHAVKPRGVLRADSSIDDRLRRTQISKPLFFTF